MFISLRITMNMAFFPYRPTVLRAALLLIKRERKNITFRKLSWTRGKAHRFMKTRRKLISLNSLRPKQLVIVGYHNNTLYFCRLSYGNSNSCPPFRSCITRVITKSDFKSIGKGSDSTPKQEASAHAPSVTDLTDWI